MNWYLKCEETEKRSHEKEVCAAFIPSNVIKDEITEAIAEHILRKTPSNIALSMRSFMNLNAHVIVT